jgi:ABC-type transporter lipoprotein component MlaA
MIPVPHFMMSRIVHSRRVPPLPIAVILGAYFLVSCHTGTRHTSPPATTSGPVHMPEFLSDPAEPVNRGIWAFNRATLAYVVHPVGRAYRTVVPQTARTAIGHAGANALFPGRLINEALQGRWRDAGDDALRFVTNTTVGVGGLFDVATRWGIARPRADFSQTFQSWGWKPKTFLMLPVFGPSDPSNAVATVCNRTTDPLFYIPGAWPASATFAGHRLTDTSDTALRMVRSQPDPYSFSHLAWSYFGRHDKPDWTLRGAPDVATLQTLAAANIAFEDPEFPNRARVGTARIPTTGKKLPFHYWIQRKPAPLAYVIPGIGSHRDSGTTLALSEHLYASGFSVVALSSAFHPEFMENASTSPLPGRIAHDSRDVWNAMVEVDQVMQRKFSDRITKRAMVGASMGGYMALILASDPQRDARLTVDRFLAINPPVDLMHSIQTIDSFFQSPMAWPEGDRQHRINQALHKVAGLSTETLPTLKSPPFDGIESKYLIGLNFRFTLRDALYSVEKRHRLGQITSTISPWNRQAFYQEALGWSFADYAQKIVIPYYQAQGMTMAEFHRNRTLQPRSHALHDTPAARVLTNQNDFLLRQGDLDWLRTTFGPHRLAVLPSGGHLGNIASPQVRAQIVRLLEGLQ